MKKILLSLPLLFSFVDVQAFVQADVDAFNAAMTTRVNESDVINIGGDFEGHTFTQILRNVHFRDGNFENARFEGDLTGVRFIGSRLSGTKFGAEDRSIVFKNTVFEKSYVNSEFDGHTFVGATTFMDCEIEHSTTFGKAKIASSRNKQFKETPAEFTVQFYNNVAYRLGVSHSEEIDTAESKKIVDAAVAAFKAEEDKVRAEALANGGAEDDTVTLAINKALRPWQHWVEGKVFEDTKPLTEDEIKVMAADAAAIGAARNDSHEVEGEGPTAPATEEVVAPHVEIIDASEGEEVVVKSEDFPLLSASSADVALADDAGDVPSNTPNSEGDRTPPVQDGQPTAGDDDVELSVITEESVVELSEGELSREVTPPAEAAPAEEAAAPVVETPAPVAEEETAAPVVETPAPVAEEETAAETPAPVADVAPVADASSEENAE